MVYRSFNFKALETEKTARMQACNFVLSITMKALYTLALAFALSSGCSDDDKPDNNACKGDAIKGPVSCPELLAPVCGCNNVTYQNSCYAEADGVKQWTDGACD